MAGAEVALSVTPSHDGAPSTESPSSVPPPLFATWTVAGAGSPPPATALKAIVDADNRIVGALSIVSLTVTLPSATPWVEERRRTVAV